MAKLRVDKIAAVGVSTETTGSVFFDGTDDVLTILNQSGLAPGTGDYTAEGWFYFESLPAANVRLLGNVNGNQANSTGWQLIRFNSDTTLKLWDGDSWEDTGVDVSTGEWIHLAVVRQSNTFTLYKNGVAAPNTVSNSNDLTHSGLDIGARDDGSEPITGYISNVRLIIGEALYTSNFSVPTRELDVTSSTVFLGLYDGEDIFADKTGNYIIAAYGDPLSSPTPTATTSPIGITTENPGLIRDVDNTFGPTFQGGAAYASQNWLTLPKGTTTERMPDFGAVDAASARGIWGAGTPSTNVIDYVTISTLGDAQDFGDMTAARQYMRGYGSQTRGLWAQSVTPVTNLIEFITISSTGDAQDFGDLTQTSQSGCWTGNSTRACAWQGRNPTENTITYVTIASMGNAEDFGDMTLGMRHTCGLQSSTRGIIAGGFSNQVPTNNTNVIQYITTSSTGNAQDFGDVTLSGSFRGHASGGNSIRGVYGGGIGDSAVQNVLEFITMASLGNGTTFGELGFKGRQEAGGCSSSTRALFGGSYSPSTLSTINYVQIMTTGDATTFGDLSEARGTGALSNGHGGLG